ncbi:MAG: integrin alpha [Planctomycetota bacterium]
MLLACLAVVAAVQVAPEAEAGGQIRWEPPPVGTFRLSVRAFRSNLEDRWVYTEAGRADYTGDGIDDIVIGAPRVHELFEEGPPLSTGGQLYVYDGTTGRVARSISGSGLPGFGYAALVIDDLDGDGVEETVVSDPFVGPTGARYGRLYLYSSGHDPVADLGRALSQVEVFEIKHESLGWTITCTEDKNGDGARDLFVSSRWQDEDGLVWERGHWFSGRRPDEFIASEPVQDARVVWRPSKTEADPPDGSQLPVAPVADRGTFDVFMKLNARGAERGDAYPIGRGAP